MPKPFKKTERRDCCILTLFLLSSVAYTFPPVHPQRQDAGLKGPFSWPCTAALAFLYLCCISEEVIFSYSPSFQQTVKPSNTVFDRVQPKCLHWRISHTLLEWKQRKCKQLVLLPEVCKSLCGKGYDIRVCVIIHSFIKIKTFTTIPNMIFFFFFKYHHSLNTACLCNYQICKTCDIN